jgi:hypothetical protein
LRALRECRASNDRNVNQNIHHKAINPVAM